MILLRLKKALAQFAGPLHNFAHVYVDIHGKLTPIVGVTRTKEGVVILLEEAQDVPLSQ